MKYYEAVIKTDDPDVLAGKLVMMDILSVRIEDPRVMDEIIASQNEYDWDYIDPAAIEPETGAKVICYFDDRRKAEDLAKELAGYDVVINERDDSEWKDKYKETFKSIDLTETIMIRPSWEEVPDTDKNIIELDPGMAFGTGDHETTSMCARMLEDEGCAGKTVLDVGTGTGILSIAAAILGADDILAVDIDPVAVDVARENIEKNGCADKIEVREGDLTKGLDVKADIVAANIVAELIVVLSEDIKKHMNRGGYFISSGILLDKSTMVKEALVDAGFIIEREMTEGDWCAIGARYE